MEKDRGNYFCLATFPITSWPLKRIIFVTLTKYWINTDLSCMWMMLTVKVDHSLDPLCILATYCTVIFILKSEVKTTHRSHKWNYHRYRIWLRGKRHVLYVDEKKNNNKKPNLCQMKTIFRPMLSNLLTFMENNISKEKPIIYCIKKGERMNKC